MVRASGGAVMGGIIGCVVIVLVTLSGCSHFPSATPPDRETALPPEALLPRTVDYDSLAYDQLMHAVLLGRV